LVVKDISKKPGLKYGFEFNSKLVDAFKVIVIPHVKRKRIIKRQRQKELLHILYIHIDALTYASQSVNKKKKSYW
jgi:hypothetical protein